MAPIPLSKLEFPSASETHLWQLHLPTVTDRLTDWQSSLSTDESDRAQRFLSSTDRDRFILSRGGLRYLLAHYLNCSPHSLRFTYGPHGKPSLMKPAGDLHFNVAHSGDWVIYGVSRCQWIGVDVEQISRRAYLEALIRRCLTEQEQATLPDAAADRLTRFFEYWTVKEACLKAIGLGLSYPIQAVQVALGPTPHLDLPVTVAGKTIPHWSTQLWYPDDGAIAAVCIGQAAQQITRLPFDQLMETP
jgi:4'-phosphopantetheinyl transferase